MTESSRASTDHSVGVSFAFLRDPAQNRSGAPDARGKVLGFADRAADGEAQNLISPPMLSEKSMPSWWDRRVTSSPMNSER